MNTLKFLSKKSMKKTTKILAIDLGHNFGWCFLDTASEWLTEFQEGTYTDLTDWGKQFKDLITTYKPTVVVVSQTNNYGHWNASRAMLMQAGVAFYVCGNKGIPGVELNDSSARKAVLGKALKKAEVQKLYPHMTPNALDAFILAQAWAKLNQQ